MVETKNAGLDFPEMKGFELETKTLTVRLDLETYAAFSAAALVMGHRTLSGFVYKFAIEQIREASDRSGAERFRELVASQTDEILRRSTATKSRAGSMNGVAIAPHAEITIKAGSAPMKNKKRRTG